jgi:hypothetical protein
MFYFQKSDYKFDASIWFLVLLIRLLLYSFDLESLMINYVVFFLLKVFNKQKINH